MPELPEVETVKNNLKKILVNKTIVGVNVIYDKIIEYPTQEEFKKEIINEKINDIKRRGKWLMFELDHYYLLSHLRMEGKFYYVEMICTYGDTTVVNTYTGYGYDTTIRSLNICSEYAKFTVASVKSGKQA